MTSTSFAITQFVQNFAASPTCPVTEQYGIPVWYKYLPQEVVTNASGSTCELSQRVAFDNLNVFLSIGLAIIEILLRVGALVAVGYIIYAGFMYLTSNGDPERAKNAKDTILNALIGLVIAIIATALVGFLGRSLAS